MNKLIISIISIITVVVLVIGVLFFLSKNNQSTQDFTLIKSTPSFNQADVEVDSKIIFQFNQELLNKDGVNIIEIQPSVDGNTIIENNSVAYLIDEDMKNGTEYRVVLKNIQSTSGSKLENITLTFKTVKNFARDNFIKRLPYSNNQFYIQYNTRSDSFSVQIYSLDEKRAKEQVVEFFKSSNMNPNSETIEYELIRSFRGSGAPPG